MNGNMSGRINRELAVAELGAVWAQYSLPGGWAMSAPNPEFDDRLFARLRTAGVELAEAARRANSTRRMPPAGEVVERVLGCIVGLYPADGRTVHERRFVDVMAERKQRFIDDLMVDAAKPMTYAEIKDLGRGAS